MSSVDLDVALKQQEKLAKFIDARQLVVKTAVLETGNGQLNAGDAAAITDPVLGHDVAFGGRPGVESFHAASVDLICHRAVYPLRAPVVVYDRVDQDIG